MKSDHLQHINKRINEAIESKRLSMALEQLYSMAASAQAPWELRNEVDSLRESYGYLRSYALDGTADPSRDAMLADIATRIKTIAARIIRHTEAEDSPKQYFGVVRYERMNQASLPKLVEELKEVSSSMSVALLGANPYGASKELTALRRRHDDLAQRVFNYVWTKFPLSNDDVTALEDAISSDVIAAERRQQLIGAVMLGALEYYDERRMVILARTYYNATDPQIEIRALVSLIVALWMQRGEISGSSLKEIMGAVREKKGWIEDLKMVFLNLVRTRDTDRISRTMKEEVIPGMMKLRPEIFKKFGDSEMGSIDEASLGEGFNPEWEEMLEKSGVADKLKELNDLQAEGGDVMLSTFAGLKNFSFFNQVANWFLPFYLDQSDVSTVLGESASDIGEMIDMAPMICDSDKYSIVFSLENLPQAGRRMMVEQMRSQNINLAELRNSMLSPEMGSRNARANHYIHDLYRFFTLYRRKNEFANPFAQPINLASVTILAGDIRDSVALEAVAEFYFKRGYYAEALDVFSLLRDDKNVSASVLQKIGYCYQQLGKNEEALQAYRKSELLAPDSQWLLRRIAHTLKVLGQPQEAIYYYKRLVEANPSDINLALNLGHCYLAVNDYDKALKQYFKVEYLDEKGSRALRPIAWCLFVQGDYDRSATYYQKILDKTPTPTDYLNYGHLLLAKKQYKQASDSYRKYLEASGNDVSRLDASMKDDMRYLEKAGVDPTMIAITVDAALYPDLTKK